MNTKTKFQARFMIFLIGIFLSASILLPIRILGTLEQKIKVSSSEGIPGNDVLLNFTMDDGVGLAGIQFTVNYDKNQLFIDGSDNDFDGFEDAIVPATGLNLGASPTVGIFNDEGYANVVLYRPGGVAIPSAAAGQKVNLLGLKFTVKQGAVNGTYPITITNIIAANGDSLEEPLGGPINGSITITDGVEQATVNYVDLYAGETQGTTRFEPNLGQRFVVPTGTVLQSVNFVELGTWGQTVDVDLQLYAWNTDFVTSRAGTALASFHKDDHLNNQPINFLFENTFPAGEYLVVFKGNVENELSTALIPKQGDTTLFVNGSEKAGMSAKLNIGLIGTPENTEETKDTEGQVIYVELFTGEAKGATRFEQNQGQRFIVPEGKNLKLIHFVSLGTWGDTIDVDMQLYAWKTNYETSKAGKVLASFHKDDHVDGKPIDFVLNKTFPAGQYLIVFRGEDINQISSLYYEKEGDTTFFSNGAEMSGMSAYIKIGLTAVEENTETGNASALLVIVIFMIALSAILYKKKAFK